MSGKMGPALVGIVEDPGAARGVLLTKYRGDRGRHRAEMNGDVLSLHHHLPARVEQRGRGIAALLDVRRMGRADQDRAHLLADRSQRSGEDLKVDRIDHRARLTRTVPAASTSPAQSVGTRSVDSGSSTIAGPLISVPGPGTPRRTSNSRSSAVERRGPARGRELLVRRSERHLRTGGRRRDTDRDQLHRLFRVAVAIAVLVLGLERLAKLLRAGRHVAGNRELERLASVAELIRGVQLCVVLAERSAGPIRRAP